MTDSIRTASLRLSLDVHAEGNDAPQRRAIGGAASGAALGVARRTSLATRTAPQQQQLPGRVGERSAAVPCLGPYPCEQEAAARRNAAVDEVEAGATEAVAAHYVQARSRERIELSMIPCYALLTLVSGCFFAPSLLPIGRTLLLNRGTKRLARGKLTEDLGDGAEQALAALRALADRHGMAGVPVESEEIRAEIALILHDAMAAAREGDAGPQAVEVVDESGGGPSDADAAAPEPALPGQVRPGSAAIPCHGPFPCEQRAIHIRNDAVARIEESRTDGGQTSLVAKRYVQAREGQRNGRNSIPRMLVFGVATAGFGLAGLAPVVRSTLLHRGTKRQCRQALLEQLGEEAIERLRGIDRSERDWKSQVAAIVRDAQAARAAAAAGDGPSPTPSTEDSIVPALEGDTAFAATDEVGQFVTELLAEIAMMRNSHATGDAGPASLG